MHEASTQRVFISYSHDSAQHKLAVLELANRLRKDGIDAQIDRYTPFPSEGWPRWMRAQIEHADTIIVVCSTSYRERFEGTDGSRVGFGAKWEGLIITQSLYEEMGRNNKRIVPVLLRESNPDDIPVELRSFTYFRIPDGYDDLCRLLTDQPEVLRPDLGPVRRLHVVSPGAAEDLSTDAESTPPAIEERLKEQEHPYIRANREALSILRERWAAGRLSVVAGAGISVAAGLPTWQSMLDRLVKGYVTRTYAPVLGGAATDTLSRTLRDEFQYLSPIVSAQFIRSRFAKDDFINLLRDALYEGASATLKPPVLCRLIARLGSKLHSIVTFNFDDLLERALLEANVPFTAITEATHLSNITGLPVYHPHGYLPRDGERSAEIVLAEGQYHDQYLSQHSWTNIVVSRILMESTCLFVGTSLSDPNLRRLVDSAHRQNESQRHFLITHLPLANDAVAQAAMVEIFEAAHQEMGIFPVWVDDFAEIPALLEGIGDTAGDC